MSLDATQLVTLGNHIRGNTEVNGDLGNLGGIRDWYNAETDGQNGHSANFWVFLSSMPVQTVIDAIDSAEYLALGASAAATNLHHNGLALLLHNGVMHPAPVATRNWLISIFPAGTAPNSRAAILEAATRLATEAEKLFAVVSSGPGGGDGSAMANSAQLVFEGQLSTSDIDLALEATDP